MNCRQMRTEVSAMIIKKLIVSAFGPYSGMETIDFTKFNNQVFLIAGDTGAGKTTIFDAVCFALYGQPSGSLRRGDTLRNQDVGKKAESYAEVTFTVKDKDYTVRRTTPEMKRPGESSSGAAGGAMLYEPDGTVLKKNVTKRVAEITGFDRESFLRVSVLPQGEFDKFLTAKTSDRQETLRRIFSTQLYDSYSNVVQEWNKSINKQLEELSKQYSAILEGVFPEEGGAFPLTGAEDRSAKLAEMLADCVREQENAEKSNEAATAALIKNSERKSEALEHNRALELYAEAKAEKDKLDSENRIINVKKETLVRQKRAEEARTELAERDNLAKKLETAQADCSAAVIHEKETEAALSAAIKANGEASQLTGELKAITGELPKLQDLLEKSIKAKKTEEEVKQLETEMAHNQRLFTGNQAAQQVCSERIKELTAEKSRTEILASKRGGFESELASADKEIRRVMSLSESLDRLDSIKQQLALAEEKCRAAQMALDKAELDNAQLQERYYAGEAARLAKKLEVGVKCPVCGSTEHPFPAQWAEKIPTDADIKKSEKTVSAAQKEKSKADSELSGITGQLDTYREAVAEDYSSVIGGDFAEAGAQEAVRAKAEQLRQQKSDIQKALTECRAAGEKLSELAAKLEEQEKLHAELEKEQKTLTEAISALNTAIAAKNTEIQLNRQGLDGRSPEQLNEELKAKQGRAEKIEEQQKSSAEKLSRAERNAASAIARRDELKKILDDTAAGMKSAETFLAEKIRQCGFDSEEELRRCLVERAERDALEKEISVYSDKLTAAAATLAEREKKLPDKREIQAIEQFDETERRLRDEQAELNARIKEYSAKIAGLNSAKNSVDSIIASAGELTEKQKTLNELNRVVNGSGESRISFETFIQMRMFTGVLEEANKRLESLSGGRYRFVLREEGIRANSAAGLDIDIIDNNSGSAARRDVSTLSGGERFMASFALAIGLSDYTLRRGAGRSADMLFIDEGFSTLDKNAFEEAFAVIEQLREQNRTVGIITHVEGIQDYFRDMQIYVHKGKEGSTINTICRK